MDILSAAFAVFWAFIGVIFLHNALFAVLGLFQTRRFPKSETLGRYAVIIGARNEERVIGELIDSIKNADYPREKLDFFVIAHNCTDATAKRAGERGAAVIEYDNPRERTVGYAYRRAFQVIPRGYDGYFVINADNTVSKDYFRKMNDAFFALGKRAIVTSFRNAKNFGENTLSCLYGLFFISSCRLEARGRSLLGTSVRVSGTGYLMPPEVTERGWEYTSITEDWELTAAEIARGREITYCDEAEFFDEQPIAIKTMLAQRLRWAKGHLAVFSTRFLSLFRGIGKVKGIRRRFSCFDCASALTPAGIICTLALALEMILCGLTPALISGITAGYAVGAVTACAVFMLEKRRVRGVGAGVKLAAIVLWPLFFGLNALFDIAALFRKRVEWVPIPHGREKDSSPPK